MVVVILLKDLIEEIKASIQMGLSLYRAISIKIVLLRIQSRCRKIRTKKAPNTYTFYAVGFFWKDANRSKNIFQFYDIFILGFSNKNMCSKIYLPLYLIAVEFLQTLWFSLEVLVNVTVFKLRNKKCIRDLMIQMLICVFRVVLRCLAIQWYKLKVKELKKYLMYYKSRNVQLVLFINFPKFINKFSRVPLLWTKIYS